MGWKDAPLAGGAGKAAWESAPVVGAGPSTPQPPAQPPQSMAGFVGGNLAKGAANLAGFGESISLPSVVAKGSKEIVNKILGTHLPKAEPIGETLTKGMTKAGVIGPSAEPRNTAQRYGAAALQALPSALIPGGGAGIAGRVGAAIGGGLGGEAGKDIGGVPGQFVGGIAGGMAGGLAGIQKGIPKPPSEAAVTAKAAGIPLTLGQETGSKSLLFTENRLRELFPSAGTAAADELKQVTAGVNRVNQLADQMSTQMLDQEGIGNRLRNAYTSTVKKIDTMRDSQADTDYGEVRKLAGGKPVIKYQNTLSTLDKIIEENKNVPSGDSKKVYDQAVAMRKMLTETAPSAPASPIVGTSGKPPIPAAPPATGPSTATIDAAMKTRSAWGKAARRTGNVFSDIDPNANQVLAKRLFGAVNKDFDAASTAGTPIAQALKKANTNYSKASQSIDFIKKSALGKLLGEDVTDAAFTGETFSTKAPEAIAKSYLKLTPSQSAQVTAILREHAPEVLQDAKSFVLRNGLEAAKNDIPGQPTMSFAKFRGELEKVAPKLADMGFTNKEIKDIKGVTDTMARAGDRTGVNPSKTSGAAHMLATYGAIATHPYAAAAAIITPYVMSKALLTQQGRDLLRQAVAAGSDAGRAAAIGVLRSTYAEKQQ